MSGIRLALIGAGGMAGTVHYPSFAEFDDVELAGLCDLVESRRMELADRLSISRTFADYTQMLDETRPHAVCVFMPPHQLFDIVISCLNRGLHVFIEKPPGVSTYQTEAMAALAEQKNCITQVGFNRRFDPMLRQAIAAAAEHGGVIQAQATFYKSAGAVYYDGAIDALRCDAIHAVDILRFIAGSEACRVAGLVGSYDSTVPNAWNAVIEFENGVTGILQTNWNTGGRYHGFEVHSRGYSARVEQAES
ncbi:MAG TPA: Gfo/Idh/MocA family oxidoreductase, partial [Chthonomonadales bacterium]|nr:Gfo/Idh/MocA family oxidoreductase [Chthonomonadales bacterium]